MPTISKVRFTNVQYEGGNKRYHDELFLFDGHNSAILLENGGGKTVFIQTLIQCILPNSMMANRKMRDTVDVTTAPAHIAVEWILEESPREYAVTCISFYIGKDGLAYDLFCYDYREGDPHAIEHIPFVKETVKGKRAATKDEIHDYYQYMQREYGSAQTFDKVYQYQEYLEEQYRIVPSEWEAMLKINGSEGGVDEFFEGCKTMTQLVDKLLIPTVEQGLSVKGSQDFYKLFDNHRGHFREYLALGEQLKEYRRIDEEMQDVVALYQKLDEEQREYRILQGKGKMLLKRMAQERGEADQKLAVLAKQQREMEEQKQQLKLRQEGFDIWKKKLQYETAAQLFKENETLFLQVQKAEQVAQRYYRNLQYFHFKLEAEAAEDKMRVLDWQLSQWEQGAASEQLEAELELYFRRAAFLYDQRIANLERDQQAATKEHDMRIDLLVEQAEQVKEQQSQREELLQKDGKYRERHNNIAVQMKEIENEILLSPDDNVSRELEKWSQDVTKIEHAKLEDLDKQRNLKNRQQVLRSQIVRAQQEHDQGKEELSKAKMWLQSEERQELLLKQGLMQCLPDFTDMHSLHLKEDTIRHRLETQIALWNRKVEVSIEKERLAFRFYDLYKKNAIFSADPELEQWVEKVQPDIPSLELGTSYALRVASEEEFNLETLYELYPFWPMTIVATAAEMEKVKQRLQTVSDQWTHPIQLVTTAQAHAFLQGSWEAGTEWITPSQWLALTEPPSFHDWLEEQKKQAEEEKENRKYLEQERQKFLTLAHQVERFFAEFPYDQLTNWRKNKEASSRNMLEAARLLGDLELEQGQLQEELDHLEDHLEYLGMQSDDLSHRIREARRWDRFAESLQTTADEMEVVRKLLVDVGQRMSRLEQQGAVWTAEKNQYQERMSELKAELMAVKRESLYGRVAAKPREESLESLLVVTIQINALEDQLRGVVRQKRALEEQRDDMIDRAKSIRQQMQAYFGEYGELIEIDFAYSGDVSAAITREQEVWQQALTRYRKEKGDHDQLQEKMKQAKLLAEAAIRKFEDDYQQAVPDFGEQTEERIVQQLEQQTIFINEQELQNRKMIDQTQQLRDELDQVHRQLDMLSQKTVHGFALTELVEVPLREEEEQRFPYARMKFVDQLRNHLDEQVAAVQQAQRNVNARRQKFEQYVYRVQEEKIRQQTLDGLKLKTTYQEIREWSDAMHERIVNVMEIVEHQQRESDQQIQHVIVHLHTHLKNICHELKEIPKMTRVRFESGIAKDIFDFTVPEWQEEEGLLALRGHLEWMMKELDQDRFRNDRGQEDNEKIRKQVEAWLHPTQLLQVINKANEIKVRCRKVTNDKKVASGYTEWPHTENWSGGEKWSKNMTLLLGILNYLAEKRGHLRVGKGNHRTVICDNPFGKASSDHVLSPVFHIAKQLGFQFIALTAHAEGKFLRDYFPVLYSCRLRETQDPSILVMTKEREIHTAYFQDHAPHSLERLDQHEQMTLFP